MTDIDERGRTRAAMRWRSGEYASSSNASWHLCDGDCCDEPLHRNRTCAFGNLLFRQATAVVAAGGKGKYIDRPTSSGHFFYLLRNADADASITNDSTSAPAVTNTDHPLRNAYRVHLNHRFKGDYQHTKVSAKAGVRHEPCSRFAPALERTSAAAKVARVIETPIFIGSE